MEEKCEVKIKRIAKFTKDKERVSGEAPEHEKRDN